MTRQAQSSDGSLRLRNTASTGAITGAARRGPAAEQPEPPSPVVLVAYNIFGIGGTVRATINTANGLARRGWDVCIISVRRTSKEPELGIDPRVRIKALVDVRGGHLGRDRSALERKLLRRATRTRSMLIRSDEDLYKGFSALSDVLLLRELRALRSCVMIATIPSFCMLAPRVTHSTVRCIGQEHKEPHAHPPAMRRAIERSYGSLDALTCVTPSAASYYSDLFRTKGLPVHYVPNSTDMATGTEAHEGRRVVLSAGRLVPEKGFGQLLEAFGRIAAQHPDWILRIFGEGPLREPLLRRAVELGVHNQVFVHRASNDLPGEMARADLFALCSESESFGMVLVEAMAHGLPCVSYESEGPRHLISDGDTGYLVPQNDEELFSARLAELMADDERRGQMGESARASMARFSTEAVTDQWEGLLTSLIRQEI